jgi:signal transduction histidine kinase
MDASVAGLPTALGRWTRDWLVDSVLAAALSALVVSSVLTKPGSAAYDFAAPNAWLVVLGLAASLPLAVRRRWPFAVLAVVLTATFLIAALRWNAGNAPFCLMLALYTVGAWRSLVAGVAGPIVTYVALGGLALLRVPYFDKPQAVLIFVSVTVAWVLGLVMRGWRHARDAAVARALSAEQARAAAAERAVFAERLRIARELHDVVSHTLSVIAVQSGVARYQHGTEPSPIRAALMVVEDASRTALDDLRRMLGVLRAEPAGGPDAEPAGGRDADGWTTTAAMPVTAAVPVTAKPGLVREWLVDAVVAAALAAFALSNAFVKDPSAAVDYPQPTIWLVVLALVASLPLAMRRRWPLAVLTLTAGAFFLITIGGWNPDVAGFCSYVALYTVAAWRRLPVAGFGLALVLTAEAVPVLLGAPHPTYMDDLAGMGVLVPWMLGLVVRRWRRDRAAAQARAFSAQRTQAAVAERAVFAERLRIARELHDVVSHTLSVIAVQSGVARHQLGTAAGPTGTALSVIEQASRTALDDLRQMLGVLQASEGDGVAALGPSPGVAELELLASAHRAAYGPVELTMDPAARSVPQTIQTTAYRLVQEALTNVRKHAPGSPARVSVSAADGIVVVQVDDDGPRRLGTAPSHENDTVQGYGLAGMRERVALFDGALQAGPCPGGGFRVRAVLRATTREAAA